ncbi:MAG: PrsW family intramembrane metalloprotease [Muribaculaceae bacterium]|nr:PrsW family intramembrane metalloprotease [Muribaculaceae bacterium]
MTSAQDEHKFCGNCGAAVDSKASFCGSCGAKLIRCNYEIHNHNNVNDLSDSLSSVIEPLNGYLGNKGKSILTWRDLFSDVFKTHHIEEAEDIFICGTKTTTPDVKDITSSWRHPWLYSRIFIAMIAAFVLLYICCRNFSNINAYPGLLVIGAFTVPLTTLMLFMEINVYKNISFYKVLGFFIIGGCASLVVTLFFFDMRIVDTELGSLWGGIMVGLVEEAGKATIVYIIIRRMKIPTSILPCMLVGASIGAGFAAFESAGYAFQPLFALIENTIYMSLESHKALMFSFDRLLDLSVDNILLRGYLAPGGHVAWAAISGAAIAIASKAKGNLNVDIFKSTAFWKIFIIPIVLHGLWDTPLINSIMWHVMLIVAVWIIVVVLIDMGLKQITSIKTPNNTAYDLSTLQSK